MTTRCAIVYLSIRFRLLLLALAAGVMVAGALQLSRMSADVPAGDVACGGRCPDRSLGQAGAPPGTRPCDRAGGAVDVQPAR